MGFLDRFKRDKQEAPELPRPEAGDSEREVEITRATDNDIADLRSDDIRLVAKPLGGSWAGMASELAPVITAGADAAAQTQMAIVKFPKGVTWNDLCVRKSDGWKLLSSRSNNSFNPMAGIKQTGLQPAAVANVAMQGAAFAVGTAYMEQISRQLKGIETGIDMILFEIDNERNARLRSCFDTLRRYSSEFDIYSLDVGARQAARNGIERALSDAQEIWYTQLNAMRRFGEEVAGAGKAKEGDVRRLTAEFSDIEERAAAAFQLRAAAGMLGMRYDNDFSGGRIESEAADLKRLLGEYKAVRGASRRLLLEKAMSVKGAPLAVAEKSEEGHEGSNPLIRAAHSAGSNVARINPINMRRAAKGITEDLRNELLDDIAASNQINALASAHRETLEELKFIYNEADAILIEDDEVTFIVRGAGEKRQE